MGRGAVAFNHGEDPGSDGVGKCVPGADDGGQIRVSRSLCRINCCTCGTALLVRAASDTCSGSQKQTLAAFLRAYGDI